MRLVLYDKNDHINYNSLNKKILEYCNIEIVNCDPNFVEEQVEIEKSKIKKLGQKPYYIWGGGKSKHGVHSYFDAFHEIQNDLDHIDYIFTALGTGTTYSGLYAGSKSIRLSPRIIGFSVAREKKIAEAVVQDILNDYYDTVSLIYQDIEIFDDFLLGGYGKYSENMKNFIKLFIKKEGLIIDSIYVGKALYATYNFIQRHKSELKNKKLVFLNSGGLFNF